jgi:hypothetical protein
MIARSTYRALLGASSDHADAVSLAIEESTKEIGGNARYAAALL